MTNEEIVKALKCLRVETGSLSCLGCGYEHSCNVHGCQILREAAAQLEHFTAENRALRSALTSRPAKRAQKQARDASVTFLREMAKELNAQRAEAEAERDALREKKRWISVTEKTPEYDMPQLALNADGDALIANYAYGEWFDTWGQNVEVTHWMPLPEAPEGNNAT
jgi:hypothetical protein